MHRSPRMAVSNPRSSFSASHCNAQLSNMNASKSTSIMGYAQIKVNRH